MKSFALWVVLALLPAAALWADPFLVVPGRSLGRTHLGLRGGADLTRLPKPDGGDAAMGGRRSLVWRSKTSRETLGVEGMTRAVLDPPRPGFIVDEIRATSPFFHTRNGLSPGATLRQIERRCPKGRLDSTGESGSVFYTVSGGIAFEFPAHPAASTRSVAVIVFAPGYSPNMTAQDVREDLRNK